MAGAQVLFQDDFSDPLSGWDRYRDEAGVTDYEGGTYRFRIDRPNFYFLATPRLHFHDVRVEVDVAKLGQEPVGEFGVICRYQDMDNFNFLAITSDGFYAIGKFRDGEEMLIGTDVMPSSPVILQGETANHLTAECVASELRLSVNGVPLAIAFDDGIRSGDVGLIAGTLEASGLEVRFDNFTVQRPLDTGEEYRSQ